MKKHFSFIIYNYCFFSITLIEKLIDFADINFNSIHYLLINFITNLYILGITNDISLEKIKTILEEGCQIVIDYLSISREESLSTSTYKIKYNDAIHFAYQKMLSKMNTIVKGQHSITNNLKPMNTNKTLGLEIDGIHIIRDIFNCLFKIQFFNGTNMFKSISMDYYQKEIATLKVLNTANTEALYCKKIDKLHKKINGILFYNLDIIEQFIIYLIPDILNTIKSSSFDIHIYNVYFGYISEYNSKLNTNDSCVRCIDLNSFITIILLFQRSNNTYLPYTVIIDKYYEMLKNVDYEKIFNIELQKLTVEHLFIPENTRQLLTI